jgi:hypothetical protein
MARYKGLYLGYHATELAAARAYDNYIKDGVVPAKRKEGASSQFKGVHWDQVGRFMLTVSNSR